MTTVTADLETILLERARARYPRVDYGLLYRLTATAERSLQARELPDDHAREVAGHVTIARLVGSHIARMDRDTLLRAEVVVSVEDRDHVDHAIAEHLHALLEPEELLVVALRAGRGLDSALVAGALNVTADELDELERRARVKAGRIVIAYHDEHICEPAALSAADNPAAVAAAVRAHLAGCRSCRKEYEQRVWSVLAETGAIVKKTPPLQRPAQARRLPRLRDASARRSSRALAPGRARLRGA